MNDLAGRVIRTPATPESSFSDDPLRMMRAARFVAQLEVPTGPGGGRGNEKHGRPHLDHLC